MPLEIEAKIKVDSHEPIRDRLKELGAKYTSLLHESNHIFDNKERTLLSSGQGLRVRVCRELDGTHAESTVTFKGPLHDGELKIREEINFCTDDAEATCELLQSLGYIEYLFFEKRRESWRLDNCLIELDEVPHIGSHIEIEGPDAEQVYRIQEALGLSNLPTINKSYISLLVEYCKKHDKPISPITFDTDN